ncbi:hypothetical protein ABH917_004764 [Thermobifida halotolerans]
MAWSSLGVGDHPRMRGEHSRTWRGPLWGLGTIPACAGSTLAHGVVLSGGWGPSPHARGALSHMAWSSLGVGDHPRMRGEHGVWGLAAGGVAGPSPHARGAHPRPGPPAVGEGGPGTIPACAGSTVYAKMKVVDVGDHPRMRGEHDAAEEEPGVIVGPSPHARGARPARQGVMPCGGTIPAYAGSTAPAAARAWSLRDHPRMRGEHVGGGRVDGQRGGTIPACAGSTGCHRGLTRGTRDHPRMRGEHTESGLRIGSRSGPSPHARGAPGNSVSVFSPPGTIPACAGSTRRRSGSSRARRDHPRMRGEHYPRK